jgi:hypothetical protein
MSDVVEERPLCCRENCISFGVINVAGRWYCFEHRPIIFDAEDVRRCREEGML